MMLPISNAAKRVGLSRVGLMKAIKNGKISGHKDENGRWVVEASELFRVYTPVTEVTLEKPETVTVSNTNNSNELQLKIDAQREQIDLLKERLQSVDEQNYKLMKMLDEQISTVRQLTDQREEMTQQNGKSFWRRLFK